MRPWLLPILALVGFVTVALPVDLVGHADGRESHVFAASRPVIQEPSFTQWPGQGNARGRGRGLGPKCETEAQIGQTLFDEHGGDTTLTIDASLPFCGWQVVTPHSWIEVAPVDSGFGDASLTLFVQPYPPDKSRFGHLRVGGSTIAVYQRGPMTLTVNCSATAPRGVYVPLLCFVVVCPWLHFGFAPTADLTIFGGSDRSYIPYSLADGVFDFGITIPSNFLPGPVEIPFRVEDQWGNVATAVGRFEIV